MPMLKSILDKVNLWTAFLLLDVYILTWHPSNHYTEYTPHRLRAYERQRFWKAAGRFWALCWQCRHDRCALWIRAPIPWIRIQHAIHGRICKGIDKERDNWWNLIIVPINGSRVQGPWFCKDRSRIGWRHDCRSRNTSHVRSYGVCFYRCRQRNAGKFFYACVIWWKAIIEDM